MVSPVWRIVIGISLVPAFATLYQRLTLPESARYIASQKIKTGEEGDAIAEIKQVQKGEDVHSRGRIDDKRIQSASSFDEDEVPPEDLVVHKAQFTGTSPLGRAEIYAKVLWLPMIYRVFGVFLRMEACKDTLRDVHVLVPSWYRVRSYSRLLFTSSQSLALIIAPWQFLWHQPQPKCRSSTNRIRRQGWFTLASFIQNRYGEHNHHCSWFRTGYVPSCGVLFHLWPFILIRILRHSSNHREARAQMDSDSRIFTRSILPYVLPEFHWCCRSLMNLYKSAVAILAGLFTKLSTAAFIVNFALLQVGHLPSMDYYEPSNDLTLFLV